MPLVFSPAGLRVLREVAQAGSFTAAAGRLGYTQSAVSRQVAALEQAAGCRLVDRGRGGAALTAAGTRLLTRAIRILDELDDAERELRDPDAAAGPVRLGAFSTALASLVPRALADLPPGLRVSVREATTPALARSLRAGTLDLAVVAQQPPFRPPDAESPAFALRVLSERELMVGVGPEHPLAGRAAVEVSELAGEVWVASRSEAGDPLLGVWPGVAERPDVRYVVNDWLAKLSLVAAGLAITTLPALPLSVLPAGVHAVAVRGEPQEQRRVVLAHLPGFLIPPATAVADALADAVGAGAGRVRSGADRGERF